MDYSNFTQGTSLPIGLAIGRALNRGAEDNYSKLTEYEKEKLIAKSKDIKTEEEMQQLIRRIGDGDYYY